MEQPKMSAKMKKMLARIKRAATIVAGVRTFQEAHGHGVTEEALVAWLGEHGGKLTESDVAAATLAHKQDVYLILDEMFGEDAELSRDGFQAGYDWIIKHVAA